MTLERRTGRLAIALALGLTLLASAADAQGRGGQSGRGGGPPRPGSGPAVSTPGTPSPSVNPLASWISDATTLAPGAVWLGVSIARWSTDDVRVLFAPSTLAMAGVSPRVDVGLSVPVYHLRDTTGATARGVGDVSLFTKVKLFDPAERTIGLAVAPVVVIFEDATGRRATWAVPVSLEARNRAGRVYGSAGYFSSGAAFVNGAVDLNLSRIVVLTGVLGVAFATRTDEELGETNRRRTDASVALSAFAAPTIALSVSVGRSFSGNSALDGGPWIAASIAVGRTRRQPLQHP